MRGRHSPKLFTLLFSSGWSGFVLAEDRGSADDQEFSNDDTSYAITAGPDSALWFAENGGNKIGRIMTFGVITEFPIPTFPSIPDGITMGPDGALWFTEQGGPPPSLTKFCRITTAGTITKFMAPTSNGEPTGITARSDGALWFTESNTNNIGRITTAGAITEFPIPTAGSEPQSCRESLTRI
jgi:virginiamycin B lyase